MLHSYFEVEEKTVKAALENELRATVEVHNFATSLATVPGASGTSV